MAEWHIIPVVKGATDGYINNQNHIRRWLTDQVFVAVHSKATSVLF